MLPSSDSADESSSVIGPLIGADVLPPKFMTLLLVTASCSRHWPWPSIGRAHSTAAASTNPALALRFRILRSTYPQMVDGCQRNTVEPATTFRAARQFVIGPSQNHCKTKLTSTCVISERQWLED